MILLLFIAVAYLLGSLSFAVIVSRAMRLPTQAIWFGQPRRHQRAAHRTQDGRSPDTSRRRP